MKSYLAALLLALAFPLAARQAVAPPDNVAPAKAGVPSSAERAEALLRDRPEDPALWFYLARLRADAGERDAAIQALERLAAIGQGFLPPREGGFEKLWDDPAFQALRSKLAERLPVLDYAPKALELEDRELVPEGIAYDPHSRTFFIGSVARGKIVRIGPELAMGELTAREPPLDAVLGLAMDAPRRILYAVSTSALTLAGEAQRRNAVYAFDVDQARVVRRVEVPEAVQLNDVAVARGGRVFASDSAGGAIFEIPREGPARRLTERGRIPGANGLAASPDARRLYVAHSTGVAVIDLETRTLKRVTPPPRENVAAIDGLYEWQGQLIGVQNVTTPGRVILMTLSPDGSAITRVQTLLSHHHNALDEPTTGALGPDAFYLLAATGMSRFNREGRIERPESMPRPTVLRVPLPR